MRNKQAMVDEFHRKFSILAQATPTDLNEETKQLRVRLIEEEFNEMK